MNISEVLTTAFFSAGEGILSAAAVTTTISLLPMSAIGGNADMPFCAAHVCF